MRYKEFKKAVEDWGRKYNYKPVVEGDFNYVYITFKDDSYIDFVCEIHKSERFVIDLNWGTYKALSDDAKNDLFKIVTEFAATKPEEREDEKRFIIPLPELVTTDGRQQYLTDKGGNFFASRRDETLRQIWKEERLKFIPEFYRQFAVEFDEEKEY